MDHDVHIDELLCAYLAEDVTADERAVVEARLARDVDFRERLSDLQALVAFLRQGLRPVTAEMLADFRRRIEQHLGAPAGRAVFAHLVSCSVTGDLTDTERSVLEIYLTRHPEARNDVVSLGAMSQFLKKAELRVSPQAARKLTERLSAKLPAAALAPLLPQATETVAMQLQLAGAGRSTVRVFVAQENPWRRRVRRLAAVAALLVLMVGAAYAVRAISRQNNDLKVVGDPNPGAEKIEVSADQLSPSNVVSPNVRETPIQRPAPDNPAINPPIVPPAIDNVKLPDGNRTPSDAVNPGNPAGVRQPSNSGNPSNPVKQPRSPSLDKRINPNQPKQDEQKAIVDAAPTPTPEPNYPKPPQLDLNQNANQSHSKSIGGDAILSPNPNQTLTADPQPEPKVAVASPLDPVNNKMVVAVVRGLAQATTPQGAQTVAVEQQLPSGTDINTDDGRIALVLPGNGRLWINSRSSVHVDLKGNNVVVQLNAGQISYRAPFGGNLTLNHASDIQVADATGMIDIKDDPVNKALVASVIDQDAKIVRRKLAAKTIHKQQAAIVKTDTQDLPEATASLDRPDKWHDDLVVPGDNSDGTPSPNIKITDDGTNGAKGKGRQSKKPSSSQTQF
jgi:anti-sigma factor RsiW